MPRSGSGAYTVPPGTAAVAAATISSSAYNTFTADVETALSDSLSRSGNGSMTATLAMGANAITGTLAVTPNANDGGALGSAALSYSDLFLASGGVLNWANGNYTVIHTTGELAFSGIVTLGNAGLHLLDTDASHDLIVKPGSNLTADRILTIVTGDAARTLTLTGNATLGPGTVLIAGRETIFIPASAMISRTTNGPSSGAVEMTTNKNMFSTKDFDTTTQEFAQFEVWFPKSWNLSTVTFQALWSHAATTVNFGVAFGLAGVARSDNDAGDVAFGTAVTSVDTGGTTNNIYQSPESAAITIAGTPAVGDSVQFQLNRTVADAGDTTAIDARLHGIRLFFTTNAADDT